MSTDPTEVTQTQTPAPEAPTQEQPPVEAPVVAEPALVDQPVAITNARVPKRRDIVDFVLPSGHHAGEKRPAVILKVWGDTPDSLVNLLIFTDSVNDFITAEPAGSGIWWRTSVERDDSGTIPGTYNFGE